MPDFNENLNSLEREGFPKKHSNIKLNKYPSSGNQAVPCRRTDRQPWWR